MWLVEAENATFYPLLARCYVLLRPRKCHNICILVTVAYKAPSSRWGFFYAQRKVMNYHATINQIKQHEGLKLKPYKCTAGKLTIGYGRNLEDKGINKSEAEEMLLRDICEVEERLFDAGLLDSQNDARKAVLINMAFQLGFNGLLGFKNMLEAVRRHEYELAGKEMLNSRWAMQTPTRAKELYDQMVTGEFQ